MKSTRYFEEIVRKKRPYIKLEWIESVVKNPIRVETQSDDRIRFWAMLRNWKSISELLHCQIEKLYTMFFQIEILRSKYEV